MHVQALDSRVLFAFTFSLNDGHLVITGTDSADQLDITGNVVSNGNPVNGPLTTLVEFDPNQLKSITVNARGGDDKIYVSSLESFNNTTQKVIPFVVNAGSGNDLVNNTFVDGTINGDDGNDTVYGGGKIFGGRGNDKLYGELSPGFGGGTSELIDGGEGHDTIVGNAGRDTLIGGSGNDFIQAFSDADENSDEDFVQLNAGSGQDRVELKTAGNIDLGSGDDRASVLAQLSPEAAGVYATIRGGDGNDWIQVKEDVVVAPGKAFKLYGDNNDDTLYGSDANDSLYGGAGRDYLHGGDGNDMLEGGLQNDTLIGAAGNDSLYGGSGDDSLVGGPGSDRLYGQLGLDTLVSDASDILVQ